MLKYPRQIASDDEWTRTLCMHVANDPFPFLIIYRAWKHYHHRYCSSHFLAILTEFVRSAYWLHDIKFINTKSHYSLRTDILLRCIVSRKSPGRKMTQNDKNKNWQMLPRFLSTGRRVCTSVNTSIYQLQSPNYCRILTKYSPTLHQEWCHLKILHTFQNSQPLVGAVWSQINSFTLPPTITKKNSTTNN